MDPQNLTIAMSSEANELINLLRGGGWMLFILAAVIFIWRFGSGITAPFRDSNYWRSENTGMKITGKLLFIIILYFSQAFVLDFVEPLLVGILDPELTSNQTWVLNTPIAALVALIFYLVFRLVQLVFDPDKGFREETIGADLAQPMRKMLSVLIAFIGFSSVMHILDQDLTLIAAISGFFGLASAFALNEPLSNLFAYFVIAITSPFNVEDRIVFYPESSPTSGTEGVVKKVGLQNVKIDTDQGIATAPNRFLTRAVIVVISDDEDEYQDE